MNRYQKILNLSTFGKTKLNNLKKSNILVIGAGGVGQHVLTYLVTNEVEHVTFIDFDDVELSNLNRQILLSEKDIDIPKVDIVEIALKDRNSTAKITKISAKVTKENAKELTKGYDVVVDAVDNWESKLVIAEAVKNNKNQLFLHIGVDGESGQYCLFKNKSLLDIVDYSVLKEPKDGVLGPMVGAVASLGTLLLINYLVNNNEDVDTLFSFNSKDNKIVKVKL